MKKSTSTLSLQTPTARLFAALVAAGLAVSAPESQAADGTWISTTTPSNWSDSAKWSDDTIADGSGSTANFSNLNITANTTVNLDSDRTLSNLTFGDTITTSGANWTLSGSGVLTLAGASPTLTVNALGSGRSVTVSSVIAGSNGLTIAATGNLVLTGLNTYTGTTTFISNTGTVSINNIANGGVASALGAGTAIATSLGGNASVRLAYTGGTASTDRSISIANTTSFNLTNSGGGELTLTGGVAFGSPGGATYFSARQGIINLSGLISGTGNSYVGVNGNNAQLVLTNNNNSFRGGVQISNGTLRASSIANTNSNSALGQAGTISFGQSTTDGTLVYTGSTASSNRTFSITAGRTATINVQESLSNLTLSGVIGSTTGALTKAGTGTLTLSGGNTYTGATTISAGTLVAGSANAFNLATGQVNVSGGTLDSSVANVNFGGAINLSSGSVNINSNSAVGTISLATGKNFTASGGTLTFNLGTAFDQIVSAGGSAKFDLTGSTLVLDTTGAGFSYGNTYQLFSGFDASTSVAGTALITGYDTAGFTATLSNGGQLSFAASAVPEPSTYAALAGLGILGFAVYRRRRAS
jgi:fibronectin-binding autotransporter adhesin